MRPEDLNGCTPGQRKAIETLDRAVMVSAGAGSGKTFTLTRRMANAFEPADGSNPLVTSIDELLAITYTTKAAASLKDKAKHCLESAGCTEAALHIDDAWISTIHSMARRMLAENALEAGIDPAFEVLSESDAEELRALALEEEARSLEASSSEMAELMRRFKLEGSKYNDVSVRDMVDEVLTRANALPGGFDDLVIQAPSQTPRQVIAPLLDAGQSYLALMDSWTVQTGRAKPKPLNPTETKNREALEKAVGRAQAWMDETGTGCSFVDGTLDEDVFREVLGAFPKLSKTFGKGRKALPDTENYRRVYAQALQEARVALGYRSLESVITLARHTQERLNALKGGRRFDNNDLLRACYAMLSQNPTIAARYRNQFKIIMVDEFQDTDRLQVAILDLICRPGRSNICTVGDVQQSIYRFRGADVEVFRDYGRDLDELSSGTAEFVSLPDNFRSHRAVLEMVDAVFSRPDVFGDEFLALEPKGRVNDRVNPLFDGSGDGGDEAAGTNEPRDGESDDGERKGGEPQVGEGGNGEPRDGEPPEEKPVAPARAEVRVLQYKRSGYGSGVSAGRMVRLSAAEAADRFASLRDRGVSPGDMALLLGSMSHADVYAEALRNRGIECVVTGGSIFCTSAEALLVSALLACAVNRHDEPALLVVLGSELFALPDDVLLVASRGGEGPYSSLSGGFFKGPDETTKLPDAFIMAWNDAREALTTFIASARSGSAAAALRELFAVTGLLSRLEDNGAEGLAGAGNLAKAVRLVAGFEEGRQGVASTARAYREHLRLAKEAPGSLAASSFDCLCIMTIHSSKGLQFNHVVVSEIKYGSRSEKGDVLVENVGEKAYASLKTGIPEAGGAVAEMQALWRADALSAEGLEPREATTEDYVERVLAATSPAERHEWLAMLRAHHELAEARRLLYVALTRAVESVCLICALEGNASNEITYHDIPADLQQAFQWKPHEVAQRSLVHYMNTDIAVSYRFYPDEEALDTRLETLGAQEAGSASKTAFLVPPLGERPALKLADLETGERFAWSYTALQKAGIAPEEIGVFAACEDAFAGNEEDAPAWNNEKISGEARDESGDGDDDALAFGSAFHRLAERMLVTAASKGCERLAMPSDQVIKAHADAASLEEGRAEALKAALALWADSALATELLAFGEVSAEVPFLTCLRSEGRPERLEGFIDALAVAGRRALIVDYKTGTDPGMTRREVREHHRLQAACYAQALFDAGYTEVEAVFVKVEQPDACGEPREYRYRFAK